VPPAVTTAAAAAIDPPMDDRSAAEEPQSATHAEDVGRFAALDDPIVRSRFVEFDTGRLAQATFTVPTLHCASCLAAVERLGRRHPAILRADADLMRRTVRVAFDPDRIQLSRVAGELAAIGHPPSLDAERTSGAMPLAKRRLYTRLGVAGFAFGNVMVFSLPRYLNGEPLDAGFQRLFDALNLALSVPVLVYSASDYFRSAWRACRGRAMSLDVPVALGLIALFARSVTDIALGRSPGFLDSFTGLVFFLLVGQVFKQTAFDRIAFDRTFRSFFPLSVRVERDPPAPPAIVPIERLRPGDAIVIRAGEVVPADAVLVDRAGLVDYALLTGEERPVPVDRGSVVRAGGRAAAGPLRLRLVDEISHSRLAGLWNNPVFSTPKPDRLTEVSARFGAWFTVVAVGLATGGAWFWWPDVDRSIEVATAVLIIACPCALTLAAPITLGTAMSVLGRSGFYLKHPGVALALGRVDTIAFDKTGTLTALRSGGAQPDGLTGDEWRLVQRLTAASTHPVSRAVANAPAGTSAGGALDAGPSVRGAARDVCEVPGGGLSGEVDGHAVVVGSPAFVSRVIGRPTDGERGVLVAIDGRIRGAILLAASSRSGIDETVRALASTHDVLLISGDDERQAPRWRTLFRTRMWFRQRPEDKLALIRALRAEGRRVLMVGDGLNDAAALGAADVGAAVSDDTACVVPACDAVVGGDRLRRLPDFLALARRARHVIVLCFVVSVFYNAVGLTLALTGSLTPLSAAILMPVSSLTVIGLSIGATRWRAPEAITS
jgi:Cu+-exporting ATPase